MQTVSLAVDGGLPAIGCHETRCLLCDAPLRAIGAVIATGNIDDADSGEICCGCATLSIAERKRLRNAAMVRMLREAVAERCRVAREAEPQPPTQR